MCIDSVFHAGELEVQERLARFIPPPRMHRHRYHGVLAPNAKLRAAVVAIRRPYVEEPDLVFDQSLPDEFGD